MPTKKYVIDESLTGAERTKARKRAAYLANQEQRIAQAKEYRDANKDFISQYRIQAYRENPEKFKQRLAAYRAERRDEAKARSSAWRASDPEKAKQSKRNHYEKNRQKVIAKALEYAVKNSEKLREYRQKRYAEKYDSYVAAANLRRARKLKATAAWDFDLTELVTAEAARLVRARRAITGFRWHADHIIPLRGKSVSGLHVWNNIAVIPAKQNLMKGNRYE